MKTLPLAALLCGNAYAQGITQDVTQTLPFYALQEDGAQFASQFTTTLLDHYFFTFDIIKFSQLSLDSSLAGTLFVTGVYIHDTQNKIGNDERGGTFRDFWGNNHGPHDTPNDIESSIHPNFWFPLRDDTTPMLPGQSWNLTADARRVEAHLVNSDDPIEVGIRTVDSAGHEYDYVTRQRDPDPVSVPDSGGWLLWLVPAALLLWRRK